MAIVNQIYFGDCLEVMKAIPDASIDLVIADLPYEITQNKWDQIIPFEPLWDAYKRICKKSAAIILTAVQPFTSLLVNSNLEMFRYDLVWRKNKKRGFLNAKKMPLRQHEDILVFYSKLPTYNPQKTTGHAPTHNFTKHTSDGTNYGKTKQGIKGGGSTERYPTSVLDFAVVNNDRSEEKIHPTQKPVELFEWLIRTYSNEGDLVLDNCVGSGTTIWACLNSRRTFVAIENDQKYYEHCVNKYEKYSSKTIA